MISFPILVDLGLVVACSALLLLAARPLRIPPILAYMVAGLLLGPATGALDQTESVALFSELGIALLLFLVGLELSLARLRDVGGAVLSAGLIQVAVSTLLGAGIALLTGFPFEDALLLGLALAFSSTVVVVKLLERSGGVASVAGRLSVGVLLVQDLVVAVVLTLMSGLGRDGSGGVGSLVLGLATAVLGILGLGLVAWLAVRALLPRLYGWIASWSETLFVVSLAWCFGFIVLAETLHVSIELGAFIAGLALAQLPYAEELVRRVQPLANFFIAVFFVALGARMELGAMAGLWPTALGLSVLVLVVKPALLTAALLKGPHGARAAFLTGINLGQVSEFGFVLMAMAGSVGLVETAELPALLGLVGLITIGVSAGVVPLGPALWTRLAARFGLDDDAPDAPRDPLEGHVVVVGMNTLGRRIVHRLAERGERVVAVDTDPSKLARLDAVTVFGTSDNPAVLEEAGVGHAKLVISALQIEDGNALLAFQCRRLGVPVSVHAFDPTLVDELLELGADHLMISKLDGIRLVEDELHRLGVMG